MRSMNDVTIKIIFADNNCETVSWVVNQDYHEEIKEIL